MRSNRSTDKPGCRSASVCSFSSGGTPEGSEPFANANGLGAGPPRDWPARVVQSSSVGDRSEPPISNQGPKSEQNRKPSMPTRASAYRRKWPLRGRHLKTEFAPTADPPVRPQNGLYAPSAAISFPPNLAAGVAETQITNRREDRSHPKPGHLCESTLTSSGFTRSGTVQPSMSYSAMH